MKRFLTIIFCLFPVFASAQYRNGGYGELYDGDVAAKMREDVLFLSSSSLEGRKAGSEGEKEAAVYVTQALEKSGVDVLSGKEGEMFGIMQESGDTLRSRNVIAYIPGYDKSLRDRYIVVGARLDNLGTYKVNENGEMKTRTCYGANGNASGLAMLLELANTLNTNKVLLKRSVIIAAFGASEADNAGSWYFLNRSFKDAGNIDAMVNLDMVGTGNYGFYVYTASNADLNAVVTSLSGTLQPVQPQLVAREPVRSDHRSFYNSSIPAAFFTTGMYPEYNTERDTESIIDYTDMEREAEYVYNFTLSLVNGPKPSFNPAQDIKDRVADEAPGVVPYSDCDWKPTFLGSSDPVDFLKKWVYAYLKYPQEAVKAGTQGRVLVDFVIDEKGRVTDVSVARSVSPLLDAEAVRVISASPDWKPARVRGKRVKCGMSLYVEFRLQKNKKK